MDAGWLDVEWPERYSHWHRALAGDLASLGAGAGGELRRWPSEPGARPRLIVCSDPAAAAAEYAARGLAGDPRAPRTFPALRLAIVPLPCDDPLLAEQPLPLRSWRESVLHEAAHLQAALRPALSGAPLWFQEGFAERWRDAEPQEFAAAAGWPLPAPDELPSELRLERWAFWAGWALREDGSTAPWRAVEALSPAAGAAAASRQPPAGDAAFPAVRGRDAALSPGAALLAPLPAQVVEADFDRIPPGASRRYELRTGSTGIPDAGWRLPLPQGGEVWLRCTSTGGLAAWTARDGETPPAAAADRPAAAYRPGTPREVRVEHRGDELAILADGGFLYRQPLPAGTGDLHLVLYARGGVFAARLLP